MEKTSPIICDFCGSEHVAWTYPCHDFAAPPDILVLGKSLLGSRGAWAACDICHSMIEADKYGALARRSHQAIMKKLSSRERKMTEDEVLRQLKELHKRFRNNRKGKAYGFG